MEIIIYKIISNECPEIFYIGSTTNFNRRLNSHKRNSKNFRKKSPLYKYIRAVGGFDKMKMEIISKNQYNSRGEGFKKEQEYIDELKPKLNFIKSYKKI